MPHDRVVLDYKHLASRGAQNPPPPPQKNEVVLEEVQPTSTVENLLKSPETR